MPDRPKILLLDDDQELLEVYREMLSKLPSQPEIRIATSGARAVALLESEPFTLLMSDLNMPKMDGLQVLTVVRRKFPHLRTAVMTSVGDPQFRTRAYAMGIDLFLEKPNTPQEVGLFMDCVESLLDRREVDNGFRGVQSKSLIDIIQLECLSHSSSVLKITNGSLVGKVWFENGDIIDAEAPGLKAEEAIRKVLSWKTGAFEILPTDAKRPRAIHTSAHGLLLESAQAIDEAQANDANGITPENGEPAPTQPGASLMPLTRFKCVDFIMTLKDEPRAAESWGVENPDPLAEWVRETTQRFQRLGESLHAGELRQFEGLTSKSHIVVTPRAEATLCAGFDRSLGVDQVRETAEEMVALWGS